MKVTPHLCLLLKTNILLFVATSAAYGEDLPIIPLPADKMCIGTTYLDQELKETSGTRDCTNELKLCEKEGEQNCLIKTQKPKCSLSAQEACIAHTDFPSVDLKEINSIIPQVRSNTKIFSLQGTLQDCSTTKHSSCFTPEGFTAVATSTIEKDKILVGTSIADIAGEAIESPQNCSTTLESDCVATASFTSFKAEDLIPNNLKLDYLLANTTGSIITNPSACSESGQLGCTTTGEFPSLEKSNLTANLNLIKKNITILDSSGTGELCSDSIRSECFNESSMKASAVCSSSNSGCFVETVADEDSTGLVAVDTSALNPGVIKKGVSIAGITGQYPSSAYPLVGSSGAIADLDDDSINSMMVSSTTFEWFGPDGTRYTGSGDPNITAANIVNGTTIFGVLGEGIDTAAAETPDAWNIRRGSTVSGVAGKIKTSCRNSTNIASFSSGTPMSATFDSTTDEITISNHGLSTGDQVKINYDTGFTPTGLSYSTTYYAIVLDTDTIQLATTSGNASSNTEIDFSSNGQNTAVHQVNTGVSTVYGTLADMDADLTEGPWGDDFICGGLEQSAGDDNIWKDVTTDGNCNSGTDQCVYEDKVSKMQWSSLFGPVSWGKAVYDCDQLTHNGESDWRLPTQKEIIQAYIHGMKSVASTYWINSTSFSSDSQIWSSTRAYNHSHGSPIKLGSGRVGAWNIATQLNYSCVRQN